MYRRLLTRLAVSLTGCAVLAASAHACRVIRPIPRPIHHPRPDRVLPMETKRHQADIEVQGPVATVTVESVFHNPNTVRMEGTYFFPLPAQGSVDRFSLWMNGEEVQGELLDADKARKVYEDIVRRIKDPGLLEYAGRGMVKLRVFPIAPNGDVRVRLRYRHVVPREGELYALAYPLGSARPDGDTAVEQASVRVRVRGQGPVGTVYSPTHKVDVTRPDARTAVAGWEARQVRPEREFLLYWAEDTGDLALRALTYAPPGEDGYALFLIAPQVDADEREAAAKDVVFVIDRSGSMQTDDKIDQARRALVYCLGRLRAQDRFNVVTFATGLDRFREGLVPATQENVAAAQDFARDVAASGGTAINEALAGALSMLGDSDHLPMVLFLTDGLPTVGETDPDAIVKNVASANDARARLFVFGVGYRVNAPFLDRLAETGRGARTYVKPEEDIEHKVSVLYNKVASPVLTDLDLACEGVRLREMYPHPLPDLFRGGQLTVLARFAGSGMHAVRLTGTAAGAQATYTEEVAFEGGSAEFLAPLWAARKVGYLLDEIRLHGENEELVSEVRRLGERYGIVTPYTSFLVVEEDAPAQARRELEEAQMTARRDWHRGAGVGAQAQARSRLGADLKQAESLAAPATAPAGEAGMAMDSLARAERARGVSRRQVKRVGAKTFVLRDGVWTDTDYDPDAGLPVERVEFLGDAYFRLVQEHPRLAAVFALGDKVVVQWRGRVYKVHRDG